MNNETPMHRNEYYAAVVKRRNHIKAYVLTFAVVISSYPRMLLEVFIRRNFGERYFNIASVVTAAVVLLAFPLQLEYGRYDLSTPGLILRHFVWYLFTGLFIGFGIKRALEVQRGPKSINMAYFSQCHGIQERWFTNIYLRLFHYWPSPKAMACYWEPLPFFLLGLIIKLFHPPLGYLLMSCSIVYSLGYMGEYKLGTDALLDVTDKILMDQETEKILIHGQGPEETNGCEYIADKPTDALAKQVLTTFLTKDRNQDQKATSVI